MFKPFTTTGIGSLPHKDPVEACSLVLDSVDIPFWPQLPNLSFHESMIPQYSEGLPLLRIDEPSQRIWVERNGSDDLSRFYETYTDEWQSEISEPYAQGFYSFLRSIGEKHFPFLKGQVTGPLTFTLGLKDSGGKLLYFDEEMREISLLLLKAKIRWQATLLKPYADTVIFFIDEPILSALGTSSYLGVDPAEALRLLRETAGAVTQAGGVPGIHCCGKADWPMVIESGAKIINFDAYEYTGSISLYPDEFTGFLEAGGYLAWGAVPTTDAIVDENTHSLSRRFAEGLELLSRVIPEDLLRRQTLLTPSCGAGSRTKEEALKIFNVLRELQKTLSEEPGLSA